nr:hypothetical protein CUB91_09165 [Serratia marcescens]
MYSPLDPPLRELLNSFKKREIPTVPNFTIKMLIESAKADSTGVTITANRHRHIGRPTASILSSSSTVRAGSN